MTWNNWITKLPPIPENLPGANRIKKYADLSVAIFVKSFTAGLHTILLVLAVIQRSTRKKLDQINENSTTKSTPIYPSQGHGSGGQVATSRNACESKKKK